MTKLHGNKITEEKNEYVNELYSKIPPVEQYIDGNFSARAKAFHRMYMPIYILGYYILNNDNVYKINTNTSIFSQVYSQAIESESAYLLGMSNLGTDALRFMLESSLKMNYYEVHPIEYQLYQHGEHNLNMMEFRSFLYIHPKSKMVNVLSPSNVESIWSELSAYVHCSVESISVQKTVSEGLSIFSYSENDWKKALNRISRVIQISTLICFMTIPNLSQKIEQTYYEEIMDIFDKNELLDIRTKIGMA